MRDYRKEMEIIRNWGREHNVIGHDRALTHAVIFSSLEHKLSIDYRVYRVVCSLMPDFITSCLKGEKIISHKGVDVKVTFKKGGYFLPDVDISGLEKSIANYIVKVHDRRRIIAAFLRMKRNSKAIEKMSSDKQKDFFDTDTKDELSPIEVEIEEELRNEEEEQEMQLEGTR